MLLENCIEVFLCLAAVYALRRVYTMQRCCLQRESRLLAARSPSVNIKSHAAASHETAACNGLMDRTAYIRKALILLH